MSVLMSPSVGRTACRGWPLLVALLVVPLSAQRAALSQGAKPAKKVSLLAASVERAVQRDLRILVLFGPRKAIVPIERAVNGIKINGQRFGFEYTVVGAPTDAEGELSRQARALQKSLSIDGHDNAGGGGAVVAVLDARKRLIAQRPADGFRKDGKTDREALQKYLETHRVQMPDAEQVWKGALAQAKAQNKNLLLHLAAPW